MASAGISRSRARATSSSGCEAPSRKEKLEWQCSSTYPLVIDTLDEPFRVGAVAVALQREVVIDQQPPVLARHRIAPPIAVDPPSVEHARHRLPPGPRLEMRRHAVRIDAQPDRPSRRQQLPQAGFQSIR